MKKLLTFAGVSALALITAAPDAFAAGVGIYNPECTPTSSIPVKIYGLNANGSGVTQVATGSLTQAGLSISQTELAKITSISKATNYDGGLTPRGILFYQSGSTSTTKPADTLYTATDSKYIATKSSCGVGDTFDNITDNDIKSVAKTLSFGFPTSGDPTLPSLTGTTGTSVWSYLTTQKNTQQIDMLIAYAANCVNGDYATCTLTVKSTGSAQYVNTCALGSSANSSDFGGTSMMCMTDVNIKVDKVNQTTSATN